MPHIISSYLDANNFPIIKELSDVPMPHIISSYLDKEGLLDNEQVKDGANASYYFFLLGQHEVSGNGQSALKSEFSSGCFEKQLFK